MQQEMHGNAGQDPCRNVIEHDSGALWKFLQLPHRRRLDDIEHSKKYKTSEKSFPREGNGDEGDELSGNLVDDDELGVFACRRLGDAGGGGDADQDDEHGERDRDWGALGRAGVRRR